LSSRLLFDRSQWTPPERLSLSEWAKKHYYLPEGSGDAGRFRPYPYQVGIMDALTDPSVWQVTWKKCARVGATKILNAFVGYNIHQDPSPIMVVQPTVEDAEGYSKEEIASLLRDCPALAEIFGQAAGAKRTADTILHKLFPGGSLSMVGANSGRGFRRVSRKIICLDEVDAYPASAGADGDPVRLAIKRSETFWDRKIYAPSTPLEEATSRIDQLFESGDQRSYKVPCPHCGTFDVLVFRQRESGGHWMRWPQGQPHKAHFVCFHCDRAIEHDRKHDLVENGLWKAAAEFHGHASFQIWAAYSYAVNATWGQIATEFDQANKEGPEKLRTFVNTTLGETWKQRGEAPDWERLYNRREPRPQGVVPDGVVFMTCGVDVQKDRLEYELVGWGLNRESWSIETGEFYGDTAGDPVWEKLDELLAKTWDTPHGPKPITMMAVDSGDNTTRVYAWCRRYPLSRVIAVKGGPASMRVLIGPPSSTEVNIRGKKVGYKFWMVGGGIAKSELYGQLRLERREDGTCPPGYCHFPEYNEDFFKQLTSEHLVPVAKRTGFVVLEWQRLPNRRNEKLDCRVYARAAAALVGIDRMVPSPPAPQPTSPSGGGSERTNGGGFLSGGRERAGRRRRGWLK
jgi:phage terminase large subunit GpA-like protein